MKSNYIFSSIYSIIFPIGLLFLFLIFSQRDLFTGNKINYLNKQKGVHVFGKLDSTNLQPLVQNNFDWITLVSFSSQKDIDSPTLVYYRGDSLEMAKRDSASKSQIELAHNAGFKVFLKPHIWLTSPPYNKWRSDIFPANDDNWKLWKKNYREFILLYAKIAEQNNVELFCIGMELSRLTTEKSDFWKILIKEVRSIYSGKITYAANWYKEYEQITFWDQLDYIGIQAYFPLVENKYPNVEELSKGWNKYIPEIKSISKKYNRPILFTEIGYKSTADSAIDPWQWIDYSSDQNKAVSTETQANCYQAFFNTLWKKDWFAGVHIWQWRSDFVKNQGKDHLDFTPQGKPAENVIAKGFE